ncbi:malto-oligosyltrehalose synthase [Brevirhabdus sp.]|uniref:malto-oligosyltrehalose synthase n=1 Tax=Brevirhabdus sp. TaxID=2004514 RepID=UPI0040595D41
MTTHPRIATYRVQFRDGMTFDKAVEVVPYLQGLGVSHLYASPIFTATAGSTHGYDVTDYNEIDPAIGGREGFERLSRALKAAGMGLMIDIVPNHMAATLENAWWREVVEQGQAAPHAGHFDIDWSRPLTLPVLGEGFDAVRAEGGFTLARDRKDRGLVLRYYDNDVPLAPSSYALLAEAAPGDDRLAALARNAPRDGAAAALAALDDPAALDAVLARLGGDGGLLSRLHEAQPWRLTYWREARRDLSYRRFFEVTGLVGTRVEDPAVFDDIHRLTLELLREGHVDALRIDHIDGLADPAGYLARLREAAGAARADVWLVVEKILEGREEMPQHWPIEGTTGYEFIACMADLMLPPEGAEALDATHAALAQAPGPEARRDAAKRRIVEYNFAGELARLTALLAARARGVDPALLSEALRELAVALPVYRTYGDASGFSEADRALLDRVAARALEGADPRALSAARRALGAADAHELRARFQQLTGPAMAKAVEDTLFYRHNAVLAANEVGCDPLHPPGGVDAVHAAFSRRATSHPEALNATSTHDTKRGEDARARLYALAEAPSEWAAAVSRWRAAAAPWRAGETPEPAIEWAIYQALAGIWPEGDTPPDAATLKALAGRFEEYLVKLLREAKLRSDWENPDEAYEGRVCAYARRLLSPDATEFQRDFTATLRPFAQAGRLNSLVQTLLKTTAPGVPDLYQGAEGGDFSLVDPDNRRPVDYAGLRALPQGGALAGPDDLARAKTGLLRRALAERQRAPALYARGDYRPLPVEGAGADRIFAFARSHEGALAVVAVPLRPLQPLDQIAAHLVLPADAPALRNVLAEGIAAPEGTRLLDLAPLLAGYPVVFLASD